MDGTASLATAKPSNGVVPPPSAREQARRLIAALVSDGRRFWRHSFTTSVREREQLRARIAMDLHFLEYGMALAGAAPGHGFDKATRLVGDLEDYVARWGADEQTAIATRTLEAWLRLNPGPRAAPLSERLAAVPPGEDFESVRGGVETVERNEILAASAVDFASFAAARHSIRQFAAGPVPKASIRRAVAVAQQSPSSCNRQTMRVHLWTEPAAIARVAALQSGNRGFGDQLGGLAVIWTDLRNWTEAAERYNGYVDGGMFAMSLILALHAEGLGTVPLNWSEEPEQDAALRALAGLPESAQVVVMVGFGQLPERLRVPFSHRRSLADCLSLDPPLSPPAGQSEAVSAPAS